MFGFQSLILSFFFWFQSLILLMCCYLLCFLPLAPLWFVLIIQSDSSFFFKSDSYVFKTKVMSSVQIVH